MNKLTREVCQLLLHRELDLSVHHQVMLQDGGQYATAFFGAHMMVTFQLMPLEGAKPALTMLVRPMDLPAGQDDSGMGLYFDPDTLQLLTMDGEDVT